jgi:hypothetical protein
MVLSWDNTLPKLTTIIKSIMLSNRRVLYPYNTDNLNVYKNYTIHIFGVVMGQHPTDIFKIYKKYDNLTYFQRFIDICVILAYVKL